MEKAEEKKSATDDTDNTDESRGLNMRRHWKDFLVDEIRTGKFEKRMLKVREAARGFAASFDTTARAIECLRISRKWEKLKAEHGCHG